VILTSIHNRYQKSIRFVDVVVGKYAAKVFSIREKKRKSKKKKKKGRTLSNDDTWYCGVVCYDVMGLMFGFEFVLREGETVQEFAGTDGTGLDDVQLRILHTVLNAVDQVFQ